jgi:hypothetical protein
MVGGHNILMTELNPELNGIEILNNFTFGIKAPVTKNLP